MGGASSASGASGASSASGGAVPAERWTTGACYTGVDGATFYLGVIDILEGWRLRWRVQCAILKFFFRYIAANQWYNPEGITAIHPNDYATRFEEFLSVHMLGVPFTSRNGRTWQPFW